MLFGLSATTLCHYHAFKLVLVGDHTCIIQVEKRYGVKLCGDTASLGNSLWTFKADQSLHNGMLGWSDMFG